MIIDIYDRSLTRHLRRFTQDFNDSSKSDEDYDIRLNLQQGDEEYLEYSGNAGCARDQGPRGTTTNTSFFIHEDLKEDDNRSKNTHSNNKNIHNVMDCDEEEEDNRSLGRLRNYASRGLNKLISTTGVMGGTGGTFMKRQESGSDVIGNKMTADYNFVTVGNINSIFENHTTKNGGGGATDASGIEKIYDDNSNKNDDNNGFYSLRKVQSNHVPTSLIQGKQSCGIQDKKLQQTLDRETQTLRNLSFKPREEKNMPCNDKVYKWLNGLFPPDGKFIDTVAKPRGGPLGSPHNGSDSETSGGKIIVKRLVKAYPATVSDSGSDPGDLDSENDKEELTCRCITRQAITAYRNETEPPRSFIRSKASAFAAKMMRPDGQFAAAASSVRKSIVNTITSSSSKNAHHSNVMDHASIFDDCNSKLKSNNCTTTVEGATPFGKMDLDTSYLTCTGNNSNSNGNGNGNGIGNGIGNGNGNWNWNKKKTETAVSSFPAGTHKPVSSYCMPKFSRHVHNNSSSNYYSTELGVFSRRQQYDVAQ